MLWTAIISQEPGMLGPWIRQIRSGQTGDGKSERQHFRNQFELKWTGMGEFNLDDHYYYCGQESLKRNGVALIVNERVWNAVLGCNLKNDRMISVCFQGKTFNTTGIQIYAPTSNAEEAAVKWLYEDLQDLLWLTPKEDVLFVAGTGTQKQEGEGHPADVAAAETPQSCPTPCDPTDGSPPGCFVPGVLQARTLK